MKALGGSFNLQSVQGRGTTATLTIPIHGQVEPPVQSTTLQRDTSISVTGVSQTFGVSRAAAHSRMRVLLVDDHLMVRQGLKTILENYDDLEIVGEASNGEEALAYSESLHPDIVVMDINMPVMNGIEATGRLKARFPDMRVIGISVNVGEDNQVAMKKAGAISLITKEAAVDTLYNTIVNMAE